MKLITFESLNLSRWGMVRVYCLLSLALFFSVFASVSGGGMGLDPYVSIAQEYDDNIFYSAEEQTEDVVTTYSCGVGIRDQSERFDVSAGADFDWKDYRDNPDLDGLDRQFDASVFSSLTERLSLSVGMEYSMDSKRDRDFEESGMVDDTEVVERVVRTRITSELATDYALSEITTAGVSYKFSQSDFDDPEFADYFSHNAGIGLKRNISGILPETWADIWVNYIRYESISPEFEMSKRTDLVVNSYSAVAGLTSSLSEKMDVIVHLGGRFTDSRSTTRNGAEEQAEMANDEWGIIGSLRFRYGGEYTRCDLSLTHDMKPRSGTGGIVNNTASIFRLKHRLTEKVRIGLTTGYYLTRSDDAISSEDVDEYAMRIRPDLEYALSKHIFLEGFYSFRSVVDKRRNTETERNLFMVRVLCRYPFNNE